MQRQFLSVVAQPEVMALLHEMAARIGPSALAFASSQTCSDGREMLSGLVLPVFFDALATPAALAEAMAPVLQINEAEASDMLTEMDVSGEQAGDVLTRLGLVIQQGSMEEFQ